jgi:hypothetical protein
MDIADKVLAFGEWFQVNSSRAALLRQIDAYIEVTGIKESTFGWRAVGDAGFVDRLRNGGNCVLDRLDLCRYYIATSLNATQSEMFNNLLKGKSHG